MRRHFKRLGATGGESLRLFIGAAPADLWPQLETLAATEHPRLIVVDTLARALRVKDFNDYAMVTSAFEPLLGLSRRTGASLLLLHHASAHQHRDGLDAVLGSTALAGSVDNILLLKRDQDQRVLSSVQRIGPDLAATVLHVERRRPPRQAGSKKAHDEAALADKILAALHAEPAAVKESKLDAAVEGRNADKGRILRQLLRSGKVLRFGAGGKKDPYLYRASDSGSQNLGNHNDPQNTREPQSLEKTPMFPGLGGESRIEVPEGPDMPCREPQKNVESCVHLIDQCAYGARSDPSHVIEGPDTSENSEIEGSKIADHPDKQGSDSGSRDHKKTPATEHDRRTAEAEARFRRGWRQLTWCPEINRVERVRLGAGVHPVEHLAADGTTARARRSGFERFRCAGRVDRNRGSNSTRWRI